MMFWLRGGVEGKPLPSQAYFVWERSCIMAAVIITAVGLVLLAGVLEPTGGQVLARAGATAYLFAGVLLVAAEALSLNGGYEKTIRSQFTGDGVPGASGDRRGAAAVGTVAGGSAGLPSAELAWLVALLCWRDIYYPVLHQHAAGGRHCAAVAVSMPAS
jgi:hypothetical protein